MEKRIRDCRLLPAPKPDCLLSLKEKKRLQAQQHLEVYQARIANAYNKMVRLRSFKKGDLVLMVRMNIVIRRRTRGKFEPKWESPYVVEKVDSHGAYLLTTMDRDRVLPPDGTE